VYVKQLFGVEKMSAKKTYTL